MAIFVYDSKCGKTRVNSKVKVGAPGSARQKAYCARSGKISGKWKDDPCSPNAVQRRRWKC